LTTAVLKCVKSFDEEGCEVEEVCSVGKVDGVSEGLGQVFALVVQEQAVISSDLDQLCASMMSMFVEGVKESFN
jgi:hypothetical protein